MATAFQPVPLLTMASVATQTEANLLGRLGFERVREPSQESYACSRWSQIDQPLAHLLRLETADPCRRSSGGHDDETYITTYEEITLHRVQKEVKFGMTLWYQTGSDVACQSESENDAHWRTEVYIGEIDPSGIAAKDGRARVGDRILEINGIRVESREMVLQLLRSDLPYIRLVVSRMRSPSVQNDDGFADDLDVLECLSFRGETGQCTIPLECIDEEDDATDDTNENERQDSGVGKTDESTRNEESSEQEAADDSVLSPLSDSSIHNGHQRSNESFASTEGQESDADDQGPSILQCQQFYEMLKQRCNAFREAQSSARARDLAQPDDYARLRGTQWEEARGDAMALIVKELSDLQLESSSRIQLEEWTGPSGIQLPATRKVPRMGTRVDFARQHQGPVDKVVFVPDSWRIQKPVPETYRADISQRWDPIGVLERPPLNHLPDVGTHRSPPSAAVHSTEPRSDFAGASIANDLTRLQQYSDPHSKRTRTSQMCQTDDEGEYESLIPFASNRFPGPVIPCRCGRCTQQPPTKSSPSVPSNTTNADARNLPETDSSDVQTKTQTVPGTTTNTKAALNQEHEWVVKRRADGSRYITRRPVRKRLLKERARRMEEERACLTTTTEDDATSVAKTDHRQGARDDRRRHAERNRARRRERETAARGRIGDHGPGTCVGGVDDNEGPDIVQLSRKKMLKCKGKRVLDDFTTLQELLAHGSRDPHQGREFNHLLSVTTV